MQKGNTTESYERRAQKEVAMLRNMIFDVGDVLIEYRWKDMLIDHGLSEDEAERVGYEIFNSGLWEEVFDLGLMTADEIIREYHKKYPEDGNAIQWFIQHGEQMHVPRPEIWEKVRLLKEQGYRIYLLSNYSELLFQQHTKNASFLQYIDGKVVSYQVHMGKPDPEIYRCLLEKYQIRPEESIFFDDRKKNIEAAEKLGIQGVWVTSREMLNDRLDGLLSEKGGEGR